MDPNNWDPKINTQIDKFCVLFEEKSKKLILAKSQPGLVKLISTNETPLLNENILNEVFELEYPGFGWYTVRIVSYSPFDGLFEVDSTRLDLALSEQNPGVWEWFRQPGIDLNGMFEKKQVKHVTEVFELPDLETLQRGEILNKNTIGLTMVAKHRGRNTRDL